MICAVRLCAYMWIRVKRTQSTSHHSNQENEEFQSAKSLQVVGCSWFHWWTGFSQEGRVSHLWNQLLWCQNKQRVGSRRAGRPHSRLVLLCCPLCQKRAGQKHLISCPRSQSVSVRWSQVCCQPPSRPCRRLDAPSAQALLVPLGDKRQPRLRADGFACFIEKL